MLGVHGTSAANRASIEDRGLVAPFPGRAVALVSLLHESYAHSAAEAAVCMHRHEQGSDEEEGEALLVRADLRGLTGIEVGACVLDRPPVVLTLLVPPERIESMQSLVVKLPKAGSLSDRLIRTGMACRRDDGLGRRSWEIAQRLGYTPEILR